MFWLAQEFCWEMLKLSKKLPFLPLPYPVTVKMKKENQLKTLNNKEHKNFSHLAYYEEILRRVLHI